MAHIKVATGILIIACGMVCSALLCIDAFMHGLVYCGAAAIISFLMKVVCLAMVVGSYYDSTKTKGNGETHE
jgi:hypothetical protein